MRRLVPRPWTDHRDHAHLCWINEDYLITDLGVLIGSCFGVIGKDVFRQRIKVNNRRHSYPDVTYELSGRNFARGFVHFLINRALLRGCKFELR